MRRAPRLAGDLLPLHVDQPQTAYWRTTAPLVTSLWVIERKHHHLRALDYYCSAPLARIQNDEVLGLTEYRLVRNAGSKIKEQS